MFIFPLTICSLLENLRNVLCCLGSQQHFTETCRCVNRRMKDERHYHQWIGVRKIYLQVALNSFLAITSHWLEPIHITRLQQVRIGDGSAWEDLPEEGQIFLSYSGERQPVWGGSRGRLGPVCPSVQLSTADSKLPWGGGKKWTAGVHRWNSAGGCRWEGATGAQMSESCPQP